MSSNHRSFGRVDGNKRQGSVEEKANDMKNIQNMTGDVNSYDRQAVPLSSRSPPRHTSSRPDRHPYNRGRDTRTHRIYQESHRSTRNTSRSRSRSPWRTGRDQSRSPYRARRTPSRSRSRSPYRAPKSADRHTSPTLIIHGEKRQHENDHYSRDNSNRRRVRNIYEKDAASAAYAPQQRSNFGKQGKFDRNNTLSLEISGRAGNGSYADHNGSRAHRTDRAEYAKPDSTRAVELQANGNDTSTSKAEADTEKEPAMSEAELIEQRRKRRAEMKARILREQAAQSSRPVSDDGNSERGLEHKALAVQHPAVQALKLSDPRSAPSTPLHDSRASSEQGSPRTPVSPALFHVDDPFQMTNEHREAAADDEQDDGPSAADYDPNKDKEEDERRLNQVEEVTNPQTAAPKLEKKEFDMFADEDEDDMFAPGFEIGAGTSGNKNVDASMVEDYPDGHYRVVLGELLDHRYTVRQQIGKGTFATVVRAEDNKTNQLVAIKIACNNDTMYKAGQKEMDMLAILNESDPDDKRHIIRLERQFMHKKHLCLVFENLGADLRETLRKYGRNRGINLTAIRSYAQQMFLALSHLKNCDILHADLKPDNILVSETLGLLKIGDLGTAAMADQFLDITPYLVSRFYRAPEVILGIPFDFSIDMWSIGCTLFELYTGRILFAGADNNQMLRAIQECRGKIPIRLLKKGRAVDRHFDANANFVSYEHDEKTGKQVIRLLPMNRTLPGKDLRARLNSHMQKLTPDQQKEHMTFVDLLERCLQLDPAKRVTPNDALRHEFVHGVAGAKAASHRAMT